MSFKIFRHDFPSSFSSPLEKERGGLFGCGYVHGKLKMFIKRAFYVGNRVARTKLRLSVLDLHNIVYETFIL